MNARRLFFCVSLLATLALAPSLVFAQTDGVRWRSSLDEARVEAAQTGRLVLLHFWSPSCAPCRKLENTVFPLPQVAAEIEKHFVPVKINAAASSAMTYKYKVNRVPSDVILTAQDDVLANYTSPLTQQDYLAKLSVMSASISQQQGNPSAPMGGQSVIAAYAAIQKNPEQQTSIPVANPNVQAFASNRAPASRELAATYRVNPPASQPTQPAYRYAMPTNQDGRPQQKEVPGNTMPSSYRNPHLKPSGQAASAVPTAAFATNASHYPAATNMATPTAARSTTKQNITPSFATANKSASSVINPETASNLLQLPAGSPSLGFEGYCPVTLKFDKKWVRGNVQFGVIHRGRTYLFVGDQQRQQFLADPETYSPVFSGIDPVVLLDTKQSVEGSRKFGFEYRGTFYLFSSSESMQKFASQPDHYASSVRQAMAQQDGSTGIIRR